MDTHHFRKVLETFAATAERCVFSHATNEGMLSTENGQTYVFQYKVDGANISAITYEGVEYCPEAFIVDIVANLGKLAERIHEKVSAPEYFVVPSGSFRKELEHNSENIVEEIEDCYTAFKQATSGQLPFATKAIYLTSDAGEGKTTLIDCLANEIAGDFISKKVRRLIIPIRLRGQTLLNFDNVIIAALMNEYRFPHLFIDSFMELVKLGILIPAFDGFEEMFVENTSQEAMSALGNLMKRLDSRGTIVLAARNVFFECKSFISQAKLYDSLYGDVSFCQIKINRWSKIQFASYCKKCNIPAGDIIFDRIANILNDEEHPLLTRPVLAKKIIEVSQDEDVLKELVSNLSSAHSYYDSFINALLFREVHKWVDRSSNIGEPLLSLCEHKKMLGLIAEELVINQSDYISEKNLEIIVDIFCDDLRKSTQQKVQIIERIKQHAFIINASTQNRSFSFDHIDFFEYFLGYHIYNSLIEAASFKQLLRLKSYSVLTIEVIVNHLVETEDIAEVISTLQEMCESEEKISLLRENCSSIIVRLLRNISKPLVLSHLDFPVESLAGNNLKDITFDDCYFYTTSTLGATLEKLTFQKCYFETLEIGKEEKLTDVTFLDCNLNSVCNEYDISFSPGHCKKLLTENGYKVITSKSDDEFSESISDERVALFMRAIRIFFNSTITAEDALKTKLGKKYGIFCTEILPALLKWNIFEEVQNTGHGNRRFFRLKSRMQLFNEAIQKTDGSFEDFLQYLQDHS